MSQFFKDLWFLMDFIGLWVLRHWPGTLIPGGQLVRRSWGELAMRFHGFRWISTDYLAQKIQTFREHTVIYTIYLISICLLMTFLHQRLYSNFLRCVFLPMILCFVWCRFVSFGRQLWHSIHLQGASGIKMIHRGGELEVNKEKLI